MGYLVRGQPAPGRPEGSIEPDESLPRACVIGAGSCGIAAAKTLYEARIPFDCFEAGPVAGGHDYPPHEHVGDYFDRYIDHFGFRSTITFNTTVEHVRPLDDGGFDVTLRRSDTSPDGSGREAEQPSGSRRRYDAVLVGNGHHWDPRRPEPPFPGEFAGAEMHAHDYRRPEQLAGKRVVYGFPEPDHKVGHAHPTVSGEIHDRLAAGKVVAKPNIAELRGDRVLFEEGSEVEADLIVYCTGYRVSFPFFDESFISAPDNDLPLYRRTFHPVIEGVYFLGLAQPLGAVMPMAEQQAKWIAALLRGEYALPPAEEMQADIALAREAHAKRFYASKRHTMEVDFDEWMRDSQREMKRGAARAGRALA